MRRRIILCLLALAAFHACSVSAKENAFQGGREIPAQTADGHLVVVRVDYSFIYNMNSRNPQTEEERDIVDLLTTNANGIIRSRVLSYVLPAVSEFTLEELQAMVSGHRSENAMLLKLRRLLQQDESLARITIQNIDMSLVDSNS
jgi:hypothetical protein